MRYLVHETGLSVHVDSAGVDATVGLSPCQTMASVAGQRGYDLDRLQSRPLQDHDFQPDTCLFAADGYVFEKIKRQGTPTGRKIFTALMTDYANVFPKTELRFPVSGDIRAFASMCDRIEDACLGILHALQKVNSQ